MNYLRSVDRVRHVLDGGQASPAGAAVRPGGADEDGVAAVYVPEKLFLGDEFLR